MFLWIFMHKFLCWHIFSVLLCLYLEAKFLSHLVTPWLIISGIAKLFPEWLCHCTFPPAVCCSGADATCRSSSPYWHPGWKFLTAWGKFHGLAVLSHVLSLRMCTSPLQRLSLVSPGSGCSYYRLRSVLLIFSICPSLYASVSAFSNVLFYQCKIY